MMSELASRFEQIHAARRWALAAATITGIHLWFDRPTMTLPHAVLIDCLGQWVFDRGEVAPDAVTADRIVAFRERADDRGLVRKVLIERTERHAAAFDDIAHAEGFAAHHALGDGSEAVILA